MEGQVRSKQLQALNDGPRSPRTRSPTKTWGRRARATSNPSAPSWTSLREAERPTRCSPRDGCGSRKDPSLGTPLGGRGEDVQDLRGHVRGSKEEGRGRGTEQVRGLGRTARTV